MSQKFDCRLPGKVRNDADRAAIHAHFQKQRWELWDEPWLRERLQRMAKQGYENQVSAVVAKLHCAEKSSRTGDRP